MTVTFSEIRHWAGFFVFGVVIVVGELAGTGLLMNAAARPGWLCSLM